MGISSTIYDNQVTIILSEKIDFSCYKMFRNSYRDLPKGNSLTYTIDFSDIDYIDSAVLGMLLMLREHAGSEQAKITLKGCKPTVKDIFNISQFDSLFKIT
jgi:anti-anti-sigma factor